MELVINVSANDKTDSAVESVSDRTPVENLEMLTVGNVEPLTITFCDSTGATPAFVTDAGTVVSVGLGVQTVDGASSFASANLTVSGSTRVGTLDLDTTALRNYAPSCCYCGQRGNWLTLEVRRVTTVAAAVTAAETLALLSVFVAYPVMAYT